MFRVLREQNDHMVFNLIRASKGTLGLIKYFLDHNFPKVNPQNPKSLELSRCPMIKTFYQIIPFLY